MSFQKQECGFARDVFDARCKICGTILAPMRILLISDIHANLVALETVLQHAPAYDAVWCLGDVVGYGPHPNECVARLRGLDGLSLTGNHDQAVLGNVPLAQFRDNARLALEWTQRVLTPESCAWLAARPPKYTLAQYDLTLVHASPREPIWEYIENAQLALENFAFFDTPFCFFGHTHQPIAYQLRVADRVLEADFLPENKPYLLAPKLLLNPGSVGQPRDGDRRAAFGMYDTDTQILVHHRVEYDIAATQRAMTNVNLPHRLVTRLAQGA
jgi:predicted phosphodiesterase